MVALVTSLSSVVAFAVVLGLPQFADAAPRIDVAQISTLVGSWSLDWHGAEDTYSGTLQITASGQANLFFGLLTLRPSTGGTVIEDARITTVDEKVHIECSNPRFSSIAWATWNPDRFFVTISGDRMEGYSVDTQGKTGSRIVFTRGS